MENTPTLRELPSWRSGDNLDALWGFLEQSQAVPTEQRVAVFDNDGTLWCERPTYNQVSFVIWFVEQRMKNDRGRQLLDDLQTLLQSGSNLLKGLNAQNIVQAVNHLFEGLQPHEFADLARAFAERWRHPDHGELRALRYQPMLELIAALRRRDFTVFLVTGGGTDFVRALAPSLYDIEPERVVGTLVDYRYDAQNKTLTRGQQLLGAPDEGVEKVVRIQQMLGRRPIFAAGNSAGDGPLLDYTQASDGPALSILIDHDDAEREYAYKSVAASIRDDRDIVEVGRESGWRIISMREDWASVFASDPS